MNEWDELAEWWLGELSDPAYADDVQPVLDQLLASTAGPTLDVGCGDGRLRNQLRAPVVGCDVSAALLGKARSAGGAVVRCRLPDLQWLRDGAVATAVACLVVEHVPDPGALFAACRRVVETGGSLVVVANHPAYTSQGSGPVVDESDGEVLWRWGAYLSESVAVEPLGGGTVVFHHRPLSHLLTRAAAAGWRLVQAIEAGVGEATVARIPALAGQEHMPRLLGLRWTAAE